MAYFDTFLYFFSRIMHSTRARPLPLSNAEWQPRYWVTKLAELGATFMKRERERVKGYQKNVADMIEEEKANNRLTNIRVRRHRKKRLEEKLAAQADVEEDEDWSTDGSNGDDADDETEDGTGPKSTTQKRKRVEKAVSKLNRQVTKHEEQIKNLKAQKWKYQRRCKKMEKKGSSDITRTSSSTVTSASQGTTVHDR